MADQKNNRPPNKSQRPQRGSGGRPGGGPPGRGKGPGKPATSAPGRGRPAGDRPRERSDGLWFYGEHAVEAAIRNSRRQVKTLLASEEAMARMPILQRAGIGIRPSQNADIARRLPRDAVHQGVAAEVAPLPALQLDRVIAVQPVQSLILALDQVTDPRNFGAILRSAAALGVQAIVVPERRSAPLNGAAAKAASGALDMVPIVEVVNLARALEKLKAADFVITGLEGESSVPIENARPSQAARIGAGFGG